MKFELDTNAKTVKLLEDATLGDVNAVLEKVLGDEAKRYRIITNVVNYNPVFVGRPYEIRPWPYWWQNPVTVFTECGTTTGNFLCSTNGETLTVSHLTPTGPNYLENAISEQFATSQS